ncbi:MAG: GNAT family protein, partial [Lachnospiraceae bacterium]|nr:GNAT family protein [Lachnospiraceae bacterium]
EVFADAEELLDLNEDNDSIAYAIVDSEGTYIGNINLVGIDYVNGRFSYNIYICREHRGKGYGTEALRMILGYAFFELRMHKMICNANWGNEASAAMMRSMACHVEGIRRDEVKYEDKYVDMVMFGVTDREFAEKMGL